jgi:hypothetical protein
MVVGAPTATNADTLKVVDQASTEGSFITVHIGEQNCVLTGIWQKKR